jgi:hypothetical protein
MTWNEPTLAEYEFHLNDPTRKIVARLGFPRFSQSEDVWVCAFQIDRLEDSRIQLVQGEDGLQAVVIAIKGLRKLLDELNPTRFRTEPYQFVFPRFIPVIYGLDFHLELCRILDEQIGMKEAEIASALRERRKRDSQT